MPSSPYRSVLADSVDAYCLPSSTIRCQIIQLTRGIFKGEIELLELNGLWVVRRSSSQMVCHPGVIPKNQVAIAFIVGSKPFIGADGVAFYEGEMAASMGAREFQHVVPANAEFIGIRFSKDLLQYIKCDRHFAFVDEALRSGSPQKFVIGCEIDFLRSKISFLMDKYKKGGDAAASVLAAEQLSLIEMLFNYLSPGAICAERANSRSRVFQRSLYLMLKTPVDEISLDTITSQLGTSRRNLEQTYAEKIGLSPLEAANCIRLNLARQAILNASPSDTVAKIAKRCGFKHMGKFSANYSSMFGELPSFSLRRQKDRRTARYR